MMKKIVMFIMCIVLSCGFVMTSLADDKRWDVSSVHEKSELLPEGETRSVSRSFGETRGKYLAESFLALTNLGNSTLGIDMSTTTYYDCDRIKMKLYLDLYDEPNDTWIQVEEYEYNRYAEDVPGGRLHSFLKSIKIKKPAGYRYRVRGVHAVYKYDEELTEGASTKTNGVLLTSGDN